MTEAHPSDSRFVLVPAEPNEAMMQAGLAKILHGGVHLGLKNAYRAMVSAAPGGEGGVAPGWKCDQCNGDGYVYPNGIGDGHNLQEACPSCGGAGGFEPVAWRPDRESVARIIDPEPHERG